MKAMTAKECTEKNTKHGCFSPPPSSKQLIKKQPKISNTPMHIKSKIEEKQDERRRRRQTWTLVANPPNR